MQAEGGDVSQLHVGYLHVRNAGTRRPRRLRGEEMDEAGQPVAGSGH